MTKKTPYVVEEVPSKYRAPDSPKELWYCHNREIPNCPVFGSIGSKKWAEAVCRTMNDSIGFGKVVGKP